MADTLHLWYQELRDILHDKGIMIFILFVPLCYPLLYSDIYTNEVVRDVPAVVVDNAHSPRSRELIRHIDSTPDVRITRRCQSLEEAKGFLKRREAYGIYVIPSTFDLDIYRGDQTYVGLYCDLSSMLYYKALLLAATDVSLEMNKDIKVNHYIPTMTDRDEEVSRMPIDYDHVSLFNPQSGFASFLIPPVLILIIQQTLLLGIGMQMGSRRERKHSSRIPPLSSPHSPLSTLIARTMVFFPIYFVMAIYMATAVHHAFRLPQTGDFLTLITFIIPYIFACIFFAMTLSQLIYRREDCILIFVFLSVPLLFLSGISWPSSAMPAGWKIVSWIFPSSFGMNAYVRIMSMGATVGDIGTELAALVAQSVVYGALALQFYRRKKLVV